MIHENIRYSVGLKGINQATDVRAVQSLINDNLLFIPEINELEVDGDCGDLTKKAIFTYQKEVVRSFKPDSRVDPGGLTLRTLNRYALPDHKPPKVQKELPPNNYCFPLSFRPSESYHSGQRAFGARRNKGKRKHGGCDLYAQPGTPIYSMDDGKIISYYPFIDGTHAVEVQHSDFIARYAEIKSLASNLKVGEPIKKGQVLAYVGYLKTYDMSMLHLELYAGNKTGRLTNRNKPPFNRREDLLDPTNILDKAKLLTLRNAT